MIRVALLISLASAVSCSALGEASVAWGVSPPDRALSGSGRTISARLAMAGRGHVAEHFACNEGPKHPCYFSNPKDSVRCVWTPTPNRVTCELLATKRAYRLRPTGRARAAVVKLARRGDTLPTNQIVVFPEKLSCQDTKTTMTCNQDFLLGFFKLAVKGSRSR
jgi:hypothetical protein